MSGMFAQSLTTSVTAGDIDEQSRIGPRLVMHSCELQTIEQSISHTHINQLLYKYQPGFGKHCPCVAIKYPSSHVHDARSNVSGNPWQIE